MGEGKDILKENLDEYFELAEQAFTKGGYNSSATLFFKAICAAVDLIILVKEGRAPSSHTARFRIARERYPDLYDILDRDFPFYQDSYTKRLDKEAAEVLKEDAESIKRLSES